MDRTEVTEVMEVNDLFGTFGNPMEPVAGQDPSGLVGAKVPDAGFSAVVLWNKTGTAAEAVLYVDNRGSPGSRDQRAYRVGLRVVPNAEADAGTQAGG